MHEYSIIHSLLELSQNHAKSHNARRIAKIVISIGEKSGVDVALIESAFLGFREHYAMCEEAEIEIEMEKLGLKCAKCGEIFDIKSENATNASCPHCQSTNAQICKGRDLHLLRLELDVGE